jgi:hypothetical protein
LFERLVGTEWPSAFVCGAIDIDSSELQTWDDQSGIALGRAVPASCAWPGAFPTVTIAGRRFMGGGLYDGMNPQLAAGHDTVICVSCNPLISRDGMPAATARRLRNLQAGLDDLRTQGAQVITTAGSANGPPPPSGSSRKPDAELANGHPVRAREGLMRAATYWRSAQDRGYAVLAFDGHGQPGRRYRDGLVFRPEWETVLGPVIDWAEQQQGTHPNRIALTGNSMGGELAPRAAAYEPRIRAVLSVDGVYDFGGTVTRQILGPDGAERLQIESDQQLDEAIKRRMAKNTTARWTIRNGMWSFGSDTPTAFLKALVKYNLRNCTAERIPCPVFLGRGESDEFLRGQPEELMKHLKAPATLVNSTDADGAGPHCQGGAKSLLVARSLGWLDDTR